MLGGCLLAIIGYAMLLGTKHTSVRYGGTFFVATGVYLGSPMVSNLRKDLHAEAFALALIPEPLGNRMALQQSSTALCAGNRSRFSNRARQLRRLRRYLHVLVEGRSGLQTWTQHQPRVFGAMYNHNHRRDALLSLGEQEAAAWGPRRPSRGRKRGVVGTHASSFSIHDIRIYVAAR